MQAFGNIFGSVRAFSTGAINNARAYKSVVNRQIKHKPDYKVGDVRSHKLWVPKELGKYPEYPYGEARIFKRSDRGLYGGQVIATGNKVSEMGNRSRRTWLPNVIVKTLWSQAMNRMIKMKLTARVLRTITKEGGLDNYVTKDKEARIKELGLYGWRLRHDVMKAKLMSSLPPNFEVCKVTTPEGETEEVKIFHKGTYNGEQIQLTKGKRALIRHLFPTAKLHTSGELKFEIFNMTHAKKSYEELLKECESLKVDLSSMKL